MVGKCLSQHLTWGGILRLDNEDRTLLQQTNDTFEDMRPRGICAGISGAPVVTFTYEAQEEDDCLTTHGAVWTDPSSGLHRLFGEKIPRGPAKTNFGDDASRLSFGRTKACMTEHVSIGHRAVCGRPSRIAQARESLLWRSTPQHRSLVGKSRVEGRGMSDLSFTLLHNSRFFRRSTGCLK